MRYCRIEKRQGMFVELVQPIVHMINNDDDDMNNQEIRTAKKQ
jgi:hypothetical protein